MGEAGETERYDSEWTRYLRRWIGKPEWSVAGLARKSGVSRNQILNWLSGVTRNVSIANVHKIADAVGDDRANALRAAGALSDQADPRLLGMDPSDPIVQLIMAANLPNEAMRDRMLASRGQILKARTEEDVNLFRAQMEMLALHDQA